MEIEIKLKKPEPCLLKLWLHCDVLHSVTHPGSHWDTHANAAGQEAGP